MFTVLDLIWYGLATAGGFSAVWWSVGGDRRARYAAIREARRHRDRLRRACWSATHPSAN